jgi:aryl-alcohol dehydrogenase-like predicted oxidoreductase
MLFGTAIDEPTAYALLDRFVERGGEWIDTADCYAFWMSASGRGDDSERVIGQWLSANPGVRDRISIATKIGAEPVGDQSWHGWPANREGLSPETVRTAVAGSLKRLGVDRLDLLWLHQPDDAVPIEYTVNAVAGTWSREVARLGLSNYPAWQVERARVAGEGRIMVDGIQLAISYLQVRPGATPEGNDHVFGQASAEQLDHATSTGMEVWAYRPLLRGSYDNPARPFDQAYEHAGTTRRLGVLTTVARELGVERGQLVLAWLASRGIRPIVGVSSIAQLDAALDAAALVIPPELLEQLDGVRP